MILCFCDHDFHLIHLCVFREIHRERQWESLSISANSRNSTEFSKVIPDFFHSNWQQILVQILLQRQKSAKVTAAMLYVILFPAQVLNRIFQYTYVHEFGIYYF